MYIYQLCVKNSSLRDGFDEYFCCCCVMQYLPAIQTCSSPLLHTHTYLLTRIAHLHFTLERAWTVSDLVISTLHAMARQKRALKVGLCVCVSVRGGMGKEGEGEGGEKKNDREIERGWVRCSARPKSMMSYCDAWGVVWSWCIACFTQLCTLSPFSKDTTELRTPL